MLSGKFNIQIMKSHTRDTSLSVDPQGTGRSVLRNHVGKSKLGVLQRTRPLTVRKTPEEKKLNPTGFNVQENQQWYYLYKKKKAKKKKKSHTMYTKKTVPPHMHPSLLLL